MHVKAYVIFIFINNIWVYIYVANMAEAAAIVKLVAFIVTLIDLSAKVVFRLYNFIFKFLKVFESFRFFSIRLPLLTTTL